jgi:hypothetical protein
MVLFFKDKNELIYSVNSTDVLNSTNISKLEWLFVGNYLNNTKVISEKFIGPKK